MNTFRMVVRNRYTGKIDTDPYFTAGRWAHDGGVWFRWAIDLGERKFPGQPFGVAYMDGPVLGGFVPTLTEGL